jgi:hypothetical protein
MAIHNVQINYTIAYFKSFDEAINAQSILAREDIPSEIIKPNSEFIVEDENEPVEILFGLNIPILSRFKARIALKQIIPPPPRKTVNSHLWIGECLLHDLSINYK